MRYNVNMVRSLKLLIVVLLSAAPIIAQPPGQRGGGGQPGQSPTPSGSPRAAEPKIAEEPPVVTRHSARVGGKQLNYTVTTGYLPLDNEATGQTEAKIFFMAYTLDNAGDQKQRPLMFSFNGGPGSASVWLHLGALGPKRAKMLDDGTMPPPPYELVDNNDSWLDMTDLVFVDTVGTGYSRATKPEFASKFFSVNGDIRSVGDFIRLYLTRYERWSSPLFLVGESYGTARVSGLSNHLFERGIGLNGVALVSMVTNFQSIRFANNTDLPLVLIFLPILQQPGTTKAGTGISEQAIERCTEIRRFRN